MEKQRQKEVESMQKQIRRLRDTKNKKIKELEEEKETLEKAKKNSAEQVEKLKAEKVGVNFFCQKKPSSGNMTKSIDRWLTAPLCCRSGFYRLFRPSNPFTPVDILRKTECLRKSCCLSHILFFWCSFSVI